MRYICNSVVILALLSACANSQTKKIINSSHSENYPTIQKKEAVETESEFVRVTAEQQSDAYLYFISIDGENVKAINRRDGPKEVLIPPGTHSFQLRLVAKRLLEVPLKAFPEVTLDIGKEYVFKFSYKLGKGNYISIMKNSRLKVWLEEVSQQEKIAEVEVNGLGK